MEKRKMDPRIVKYFLLAAVLVLGIRYFNVLLGGAGDLWSIASPLIAGCAVAYVLNIVMRKLEKLYFPNSGSRLAKRTRRPVCIVLSLVLIAAVIYLILRLVVPELIKAFAIIGQSIPVAFREVVDWLAENLDEFPQTGQMLENLQNLNVDWNSLWDSVINYLKAGIGGFLNSTVTLVGSLVGAVVNSVIALIFAIYILASKEKLADQLKRTVRAFVRPCWIERCKRILVTADRTFSSFIVGQVTEAVVLGSLCTAGMLIFRFPYAPMIGAFIGATALIPIVGAYLGAAVGAFMILTQDPLKALLFLIFIIILQQLEGNLIYPKVVGSSIGLPGMWVLAAVTIGGGVLGIPGMLLGVPSAATLYKLLGYGVNRRNARREREKRAADAALQKGGKAE
ncbi:MAG TPA: AI-2E family transporter [Candidatus Eisenbergiella pullicola]|nr:AI-2E family transporter [Candidatus Eisenbergiella pullicola]